MERGSAMDGVGVRLIRPQELSGSEATAFTRGKDRACVAARQPRDAARVARSPQAVHDTRCRENRRRLTDVYRFTQRWMNEVAGENARGCSSRYLAAPLEREEACEGLTALARSSSGSGVCPTAPGAKTPVGHVASIIRRERGAFPDASSLGGSRARLHCPGPRGGGRSWGRRPDPI